MNFSFVFVFLSSVCLLSLALMIYCCDWWVVGLCLLISIESTALKQKGYLSRPCSIIGPLHVEQLSSELRWDFALRGGCLCYVTALRLILWPDFLIFMLVLYRDIWGIVVYLLSHSFPLHNAFHGSSLGVVVSVIPLFWAEGRQRRHPLPVEWCGFSAVFLFYNWSPACVAIGAGIA